MWHHLPKGDNYYVLRTDQTNCRGIHQRRGGEKSMKSRPREALGGGFPGPAKIQNET